MSIAKSQWVCWKCGANIAELPQPLSRFAECKQCRAPLHVCRQCEFYATNVAKHCREPIAEEVKDKIRANVCDYFKIKPDAYKPADQSAGQAAKSQLDALFGLDGDSIQSSAGQPLSDGNAENAKSKAKAELDKLFGIDKKES